MPRKNARPKARKEKLAKQQRIEDQKKSRRSGYAGLSRIPRAPARELSIDEMEVLLGLWERRGGI